VYGGNRVGGTVVGPPQANVDGAIVSFWDRQVHETIEARVTSGRYQAFLASGLYNIEVNPPSVVSGIPWRDGGQVDIASDTTLDFSLNGHPITGLATGPEGAPLPGATIYIQQLGVGAGANTNAQGEYVLYLPDGHYGCYAFPPVDSQYIFSRSFSEAAVGGPTTVDFPFVGVTWEGVVRDLATAAPVPAATVRVRGVNYFGLYLGRAKSITDSSGKFRLSVESPERYDLMVTAAGYETLQLTDLDAGADSVFDLVIVPP
jgi:hypothetical protein